MDKLKYIKLEREDGTYSDSIPLSVDSDHVDINGNTLTNELSSKASNSDVNLKVSNLQSQIDALASGSPLVASDTSEMTDTTKVYVNTTDGHWYYYDGDSWEDGGVYQGTSDTTHIQQQIDDNEHYIYDYTPEFIHGKAISTTGSGAIGGTVGQPTSSATFNCIDIPCNPGDKFKIKGYADATSQRMIIFYDENRIALERSTRTDAIVTLVMTAPENAVGVACNLNVNYEGYLLKYTEEMEKIDENITNINNLDTHIQQQIDDNEHYIYDYTPEFIHGKAISTTGSGAIGGTVGQPTSSATFNCIDIPCNPGDKFKIKGYADATSQRMIIFYDENRIALERSTRTDAIVTLVMTAPENAVGVACNLNVNYEGYLLKYTEEMEKIDEIHNVAQDYIKFGLKNNTSSTKFISPKFNQVYEYEEIEHTHNMDIQSFNYYYSLFHQLYTSYSLLGLEEINMSTEYLANNDDAIPEYITNLTNGGMYLYHLPPRDNNGFVDGTHSKKIKLLLTGGIHGGEKKSIWNLYYLLKNILEKNSNLNYGLSIIRNYCDIYIIPLCNPYGIENNIRKNANINLNRDFYVPNWSPTSDSGSTFNSQYETRCISWWINKISPNAAIDHHTSSGTDDEGGKFTQWGLSKIVDILSLVDEQNILMTQEIKNEFPSKFQNYNNVFGHSVDGNLNDPNNGLLYNHCYSKNIISATFEVVMHVKWDNNFIFAYNDTDETSMMSVDYQSFINFLLSFINKSCEILNSELSI